MDSRVYPESECTPKLDSLAQILSHLRPHDLRTCAGLSRGPRWASESQIRMASWIASASEGEPDMQTLIQDLRYSARQLIKNPGFTLTAVISLALGIGATTAVFSVIYAVLMDPYPFPAADRIVRMTVRTKAEVAETPGVTLAAISSNATPPRNGWNSRFEILGRPAVEQQMGSINLIGPGYFAALRIPLLEGRIWARRRIITAPIWR